MGRVYNNGASPANKSSTPQPGPNASVVPPLAKPSSAKTATTDHMASHTKLSPVPAANGPVQGTEDN